MYAQTKQTQQATKNTSVTSNVHRTVAQNIYQKIQVSIQMNRERGLNFSVTATHYQYILNKAQVIQSETFTAKYFLSNYTQHTFYFT
jgi:hypothetical protein